MVFAKSCNQDLEPNYLNKASLNVFYILQKKDVSSNKNKEKESF